MIELVIVSPPPTCFLSLSNLNRGVWDAEINKQTQMSQQKPLSLTQAKLLLFLCSIQLSSVILQKLRWGWGGGMPLLSI